MIITFQHYLYNPKAIPFTWYIYSYFSLADWVKFSTLSRTHIWRCMQYTLVSAELFHIWSGKANGLHVFQGYIYIRLPLLSFYSFCLNTYHVTDSPWNTINCPLNQVQWRSHGATPFIPFQNGNTHGLGLIIRNSEVELLKLSTGVLPASSPLENKLNAIHQGMIKVFEENFKEVMVETDNLDAIMIIKNFPHNVPQELATVAKQIFIRLNDQGENAS